MSGPLISNIDKGSIEDAYNTIGGCLYNDQTIMLDEVKNGNTYRISLEHTGNHDPVIRKIYLIGTKLLVLCQQDTKPCQCLNIEDGEFTFDVQVGYADPDSLELIAYLYNKSKNRITKNNVHLITNEGVYLHRILLEQKILKDSEWEWPWNWDYCQMLAPLTNSK